MARAGIVVEAKHPTGWRHAMGQPASGERTALAFARILEERGTRTRVYRRTPDGPKVIYESPRS